MVTKRKASPADAAPDAETRAFIDRISAVEGNSNAAWWNIGKILVEAADHFKSDRAKVRDIYLSCKISESKAIKLIQVARSKRLDEHMGEFANVPSWTILYELTALTTLEFKDFLANHPRDQRITVASLNKASGKKKEKSTGGRITLFRISVDSAVFEAGEYDKEAYFGLLSAMLDFQRALPAFAFWDEHPSHTKPKKLAAFMEQLARIKAIRDQEDQDRSEAELQST